MPGFYLVLIAALALLVAGYALVIEQRRRQAVRALTAVRRRMEDRGRALSLLARELQAPGLALLGQAAAAPPPHGTAIAAEGRRLLRLADDITDYLAADAGPRRLSPAAVPLAPLLEESVATTVAQLGPGTRQWRVAEGFGALTLQADRRALRGALLQVLDRAARMTREGDWIDLRPVLTPDSVAIVVEDEGAGLPAEDLAAGAADGSRGLGFGLAVARSLLEAHGGALTLEALPGVGARAWLTLPRDRLLAA